MRWIMPIPIWNLPSTSLLTRALLTAATIFFAVAAPGNAEARAKRVLYLGDSMSMGAFGRTLDAELREAGVEVYTYVCGGGSPYYWLSRYPSVRCDIGFWKKTPRAESRVNIIKAVPKLEPLLAEHDPDVVVIQTGTNLYSSLRSKRQSAAKNEAEVRALVRNMCEASAQGGRSVYWIAPPSAHPQRYGQALEDQLWGILNSEVARFGRAYNSRAVTRYSDPYPENDGIHYGPTEARAWAKSVAGDLVGFLKGGKGQGRKALPADTKEYAKEVTEVRRAMPVQRAAGDQPFRAELKLLRKSEPPKRADYKNALGVYEYQVVRVFSGSYPYDRVHVARRIILNRRETAVVEIPVGSTATLPLDPIADHPDLQRMQMADSLPNSGDYPLFVVDF